MSEFIRKATIDDIDDLEIIESSCFVDPWKRKDLEYELLENPVNTILVIEKDLEIIGFIDFMITFNSATVSQIAVLEEYRNKGYGTKLLNEMETLFPKDGDDEVETVTLEVRASNVGAISLYHKHGYEDVVIKPKYYSDGEDAIYMVKRLLKWQ